MFTKTSWGALLVAGAVLSTSVELTAQTSVGGLITTSTTWDPAGSPYCVNQSIIIAGNAVLTVMPGTEVQIAPGLGIDVGSSIFGAGTLDARGTASQPIVFTSKQSTPAPGDWSVIRFTSDAVAGTANSGCALVHCEVRYGGGGGNNFTVDVATSIPVVSDCLFRDNDRTALRYRPDATSGPVAVKDCAFTSNRGGGGMAAALDINGGSTVCIEDCDFTANNGVAQRFAVHIQRVSSSIELRRNRFTATTVSSAFALVASTLAGGRITLEDNDISGNASSGASLVASNYTITGNTISSNGGQGIVSDGGNPVYRYNKILSNGSTGLTAVRHNVLLIEGNTVAGNQTTGNAGGLLISSSGGNPMATVQDNLFANNIANGSGGGVLSQALVVTFENNCFIGTDGGSGGGLAISNANSVSVVNNRFSLNSAQDGGAVFALSPITFTGNTFVKNAADATSGEGGALFARSANISLAEMGGQINRFAGNSAAFGTGIYFDSPNPQTLDATAVRWDSWPAGSSEPLNLIFDFFDMASLGFVLTSPVQPASPRFYDAGGQLPGASSGPRLDASGTFTAGGSLTLDISGAAPGVPAAVLLDILPGSIFLECGVIVPLPTIAAQLPNTDVTGSSALAIPLPNNLPVGLELYVQGVLFNATSPNGLFSLTNGVVAFN